MGDKKKEFKVRKIPVESVIDVLTQMKNRGVEFVDLYCIIGPDQDFLRIEEYFPILPESTTTEQTTKEGPITDEDINDLI